MNEDNYHEQNSCYNSNSFGFNDCQPPQYTVNHPIFNIHHDYLDSQKELSTTITKLKEQMTSLTSFCEIACQIVQQNQEEKRIKEEQAAKAQNQKLPISYDDDDDEEESNSLKDNIISELPSCSAVTPSEHVDSLSMGDEHLDTIPATESDKFMKSCVENLVPNPKKIFSNPLFEEEITSIRIDQYHFNAESDLVESMLNRDSSVISSSLKIDSLLDEFVGDNLFLKRLFHDDPIPLSDTLDFSNVVRVFLPFFTYPELAEYINTPGWNRPAFCNNGDDDDEDCTIAVTPDFPITDSLVMENEHLDTISETELDEFIKSSVENLVPIPKRLIHDDPIPLPDTLDFSNVVRVFLPFFTYLVTSSILLSSGSEDTVFDPDIYRFSSLEPDLSHRCGTFNKFNTHRSHLNESPMDMLFSTCSPMDQ
nr:hypothetical protein [Tanacetum cinerariifolium]